MFLGRVHGATISKYTGFPNAAAASIRIGTSGRSGYAPVHAERASAKTGGIHCDGTDENRSTGRPACSNSDLQSGEVAEADAARDSSICAGTASRLTSRPVRSSVRDTIPDRVAGGLT